MSVDWNTLLGPEKAKPYFKEILKKLDHAYSQNKVIYPAKENIFNAIKLTPFNKIKVVILGQDPYHGPGQAHGLCFSVLPGTPFPPSLRNIFKELENDCGVKTPSSGCLEHWAKQGVLLLNHTLTVEAGQAGSHSKWGWDQFTHHIIQSINTHLEGVVFLLWGAFAQQTAKEIDPIKHHILKTTHPSPLSAHRGFLGCKHFSKTNALLSKDNREIIDW